MEKYIDILINIAPKLIYQHVFISIISILIAVFVGLPIGVLLTRDKFKNKANAFVAVLNTAQGVPSLAIIAIFLRFLGIGVVPSIVALTLYGLLPIIQNTIAGISALDDGILEAANGIGLSKKQVFMKVELPLAFPVIVSGIQTSAVLIVGTAAIAQLIGAGGLGKLIFTGITQFKPEYTLVGAGLSAIIAITFDKLIGLLGKKRKGERV